MTTRFARTSALLPLVFASSALLLAACGAGEPRPTLPDSPHGALPPAGSLGVIAYIDDKGCIARVDAATGTAVALPFCAASKAGITTVTWLDEGSAAYATAESRALGWQVVDFATGTSSTMPMADAPRVFLIPPQAYSPRGEELLIDRDGLVTRDDPTGSVRVFPAASRSPNPATRVHAWSPDADWVLLSASTDKDLWVVGRNGEQPHRVAAESRGVASWFMPNAGAMPHADLTCSVTTSASYSCEPALRLPLEGATVAASGSGSTLDFSWSACPGATGYELVVFAGETGTPLIQKVTVGTFAHPPLSGLPSGTLRWKVRALIGPTPAPWSPERTLTISGGSIG